MPDNSANNESKLDKLIKEQRSEDVQSLIEQCNIIIYYINILRKFLSKC